MSTRQDEGFDQLVEAFLAEYTGQDLARLSGARLAIESLMRSRGLDHASELLAQAREDYQLRQLVINVLTVPETWFFRDHVPFLQLADELRRLTNADPPIHKLNILCWPCATGEEAYSIAAVAHAQGRTTSNVRIDARDINSALLEKARLGEYSMHSFRGGVEDRWRHGLRITQELIIVEPVLRDLVEFAQGNARDAYALCGGRRYEVIFCRNLLIYLSAAAQQEVLEQLLMLLQPNGVLFVGHAETSLIKNPELVALTRSGTFAFKRVADPPVTIRKSWSSEATAEQAPIREPRRGSATASLPRRTSHAALQTLAELKLMANSGRLEEAQQRCNTLLNIAGDDAEVSYVCALVALAQGQHDQSRLLIDRVLDHMPNHVPALLMSAAQHEASGDRETAQLLRARAAQHRPPETEHG